MDKFPLPTDNIYKFYALFGLLLIVLSIGAMVVVGQKQNDTMLSLFQATGGKLHPEPNFGPNQTRQSVEEGMMKVTWQKLEWQFHGLEVLLVLGGSLSVFGFGQWHRMVQPIQDEMLLLQAEKLRLEVAAMRVTAGAGSSSGA